MKIPIDMTFASRIFGEVNKIIDELHMYANVSFVL